MPDDDDMVLPDARIDSQTSTQPLDSQDTPVEPRAHPHHSSAGQITDDSFHSAQENIRLRGATIEPMEVDSAPKHKIEVQIPTKQSKEKEPVREPQVDDTPAESVHQSRPTQKHESETKPEQQLNEWEDQEEEQQEKEQDEPAKSAAKMPTVPPAQQEKTVTIETQPVENRGSPSDDSSPDRPLIRKSSLNFASLPAREPLTKRSLGGSRLSRVSHVDVTKSSAGGSNYPGRQTGGLKAAQEALDEDPERDGKMDVDEKELSREEVDAESRVSKLHSKSSTQRLHEKISMLGKTQPSRPSKSIPSVASLATNQVAYPELPAANSDERQDTSQKPHETPAPEPMEVDNEDWIKPLGSAQGAALRKSQTMDVMEQLDQNDEPSDLTRDLKNSHSSIDAGGRPKTSASMFSPRQGHQKSVSVSNFAPDESTTPIGSPGRQDGPLSASKSRLQSIMRSAKGLFSSSGGPTAAARVESASPETPRTAARNRANTHTAGVSQVPRPTQFSSPIKQGRRTRSSTEREERRKQQELEERRREEEEKAREQEKQKAAELKAAKEKSSVEPVSAPSPKRLPRPQRQPSKEPESNNETGLKHAPQPSKLGGRSVRPARAPTQQPKPQPVSIRVGSALSRQMPLASSSLSSTQESNPPIPGSASKQPTIKKKTSNSSLHTAPSTSSFKSSVSSQSQRKAQLASERKKEQEEREARRKEEQKRELERKRAAQQQQQQEEARRQEMRSRADAERKEREQRERERAAIEDSKKAAHMQAIEKRRLENARRVERQGSQQPEVVSRHPFVANSGY